MWRLLFLLPILVLACTGEHTPPQLESSLARSYDSLWRFMGTGRLPIEIVEITDSLILSTDALPPSEEITEIIYGRGKALFKVGAYPEALTCMGRVIERQPRNADLLRQALLFSGHALRACNDTLGALATYKAVLVRTKPQEQARIADAEANIGMVFSWIGMRDSARVYALRARPRFAAMGDTAGVAWTQRIVDGVSFNSLPHERVVDSVLALPPYQITRMPIWETVLDADNDAVGLRWLATSTGLYRSVGRDVDQPIRDAFARMACLRVVRQPDDHLAVLSATGSWFTVDPVGLTAAEMAEPPTISHDRLTLPDRPAYVPPREPVDAYRAQLPTEVDADLVVDIGPGPDSTVILYRGQLPPIQWWPEQERWELMFTREGAVVGPLPVNDVAWINTTIFGSASYTGLARWTQEPGAHRFKVQRSYRDGTPFHPGGIERVGERAVLLHTLQHTSLLSDQAITRIPPNGIDTSSLRPAALWLITSIGRDGTAVPTTIPLAAGTRLDGADSVRISTTTANEVDWFLVDVAIDDGAEQRLSESGWLNLSQLSRGEHTIRVSWGNGDSPATFMVNIDGAWYSSTWGIILLVLVGAGLAAGISWYFTRRRTQRLLDHQRLLHEERERIARDLHDHVGSQLARMSVLVQRIERTATTEEREQLMQRMRNAAREATRSLRDVLTISQTDTVTLQDVIALLRERIRELAGDVDFVPEFDIDPEIHQPLTGEQRHHLVMFVMEAVNNAARHGDISTIGFVLQRHDGAIELAIIDDGIGRSEDDRAGMGTASMEHRADVLGAELQWDSGFAGGTVVRLRWTPS